MGSREDSSDGGRRVFDRRRFIQRVGVAGIAGVAGCFGDGDGTTDEDGGTATPTDDEVATTAGDGESTPTPGESETATTSDDGRGGDERDDDGVPPAPADLRVEYEREPNNLDPGVDPRFSWEVPAASRGVEQAAYRIRVVPEEGDLDDPDAWDSGTVESAESTNVPFDGDALAPGTTYDWTVRIRDAEGEGSEWSDPSQFTTALPDEEGYWDGEWIGAPASRGDDLPGGDWTDYTYEATFSIERWAAGFLFRAQDDGAFYLWQVVLRSSASNDTDHHLLRTHVFGDDSSEYSVLREVPIDDVLSGTEHDRHRITIDVRGEEFTTFIDDQRVDVSTDSTLASGTVGFWAYGSEHMLVDSVEVTAPDDTVLFSDDFDHPLVKHFDRGSNADGQLSLHGTEAVLRGSPSTAAPHLRREVTFEREIESARLYVSGLGFYRLYVNGERIGDRELDPGRTDYEERVLYATYDVGDVLRAGENAFGITLGRGRYGGLADDPWNWDEAPWWSDPEALFQLDVEFADGATASLSSDGDWRVTGGPTLFDEIYEGERYDATEEMPGWTEPGFDDGDWDDVRVGDGPGGTRSPQRVQPIRVVETISADEVWEPQPGVYVFDLGQMIAGWPKLEVTGPSGTAVDLILGEKLDDDGTVHEIDYSGMKLGRHTYVLNGEGTETWTPRYTYTGFRYVQVEGYPGDPGPDAISGDVLHTAIDESSPGEFESSNGLLNRIHENTRWALLNNHHSVPTDTPTFEKNGWTGDAVATAPTALYNFDMARFYGKWLRDLRDAQRESGEVPTIVPTPDWSYEDAPGWEDVMGPTPGWDMAYFVIPWLMYRHAGDERVLRNHYEPMKRYMAWFERHFEGYTPDVGLGDWVSPGNNVVPITATSFYYRELEILANTARVLGHDADAAAFDDRKERVREAFDATFFDPDVGYYGIDGVDGFNQTANVVPLAFGMVPDDRIETVVDSLVHDITRVHDGHLNTGLWGTTHLLPVLSEYGHHDVAYTVATRTTHPSWGWWIENGATALFETWSLEARSRDHHFLGAIDEWFYRHLAGIKPAAPGFERVCIEPHVPEDLEWVDARTDTVRGTVASTWRQAADGLTLDVTVPGNTTADVRIPTFGGEDVLVRENGETIWESGEPSGGDRAGIRSVERVDDRVTAAVGGGEYRFELRQN